MQTNSSWTKFKLNAASRFLINSGPRLARNPVIAPWICNVAERRIRKMLEDGRKENRYPAGVLEDRTIASLAMVKTARRVLAEYNYSPAALNCVFDIVVKKLLIEQGERTPGDLFKEQYGTRPPAFLVIAPSKACNLQCTGCYADAGPDPEHMDWDLVDQIVTQTHDLWGARFVVLTGGEPLAYRSQGKTVLDLAEKHPDMFFMMYTNGTLINDQVAHRMGELGNLSPAISVEGWRERTDARRGAGVFDKVLATMARLRTAGVPFGISLTATRHNCEEIFSDQFIDYFFLEQKALYGWTFQYMPIGRKFTLDLMVTPQQRLWMWHRMWEMVRQKGIFLVDFWNSGTLCEGCISAGRDNGGGYFYIDWNGAVTPCVFVPYSPINVKDVFARGGTMNDVWADPFFAAIRSWQTSYKHENILMPCPNRDHNADLRQIIRQFEPEPIDINARAALLDGDYASGLDRYDQAYQDLTKDLWKNYYVREDGNLKGEIPDLPEVAVEIKHE
jgi:MoaA/NifB/PqqE/SkfB family radical SAM enzyme